MPNLVATAETDIDATPARVWKALTDPDEIEQYMFGSRVETDWHPGSAISWRGEYEGKPYEDKGEILEIEEGRLLKLTHYSAMSGAEDVPESYHTLTYSVTPTDSGTHLALRQDNNVDEDEVSHSEVMWGSMLQSLKKVVEQG